MLDLNDAYGVSFLVVTHDAKPGFADGAPLAADGRAVREGLSGANLRG